MTDTMQRCMNWMMAFGPLAMLFGFVLVVALIILVGMIILRLWSSFHRS
jgi:hypothetical protein